MIGKKLLRRDVLKGLSAASFAALATRPAFAAPVPPHPNPATFQSGDFLWPAMPDAFIPRYALRGIKPNEEAAEWEEERSKFVESARASGNADQLAAAEEMQRLTYEEFKARYFEGRGDGGDGTNLRGFATAWGRHSAGRPCGAHRGRR